MSGWSRMRAALRNLAHRQRAEADLDAEVRACAEMLADEKMAGGIPAEEAWRRALAELGGAEQMKQAVRDERAGAGVEELWQDVRFGLRQLRRSPGFAVTGLLIIAMGLGVTTAMYSIVYAVILKPLPFTQPYRLVAVGSKPWRSFSLPTMEDWQKNSRILESIAAYTGWAPHIESSAGSRSRQCAAGVAEILGHAGRSPAIGTGFHAFRQREGLLQPGDCDRWLLAADGRRQCSGWPHDPARLPNLRHHRSFDATCWDWRTWMRSASPRS